MMRTKDIALAEFEKLLEAHGNRLSPRILVEAATPEESPLHGFFEWNDAKAGEKYRLAQAGALIRQWHGAVLKIDEKAKVVHIESVRRLQSPGGLRGHGQDSYRPVEDILSDPEQREDLLATVLKELQAYRKRYAELEELAHLWEVLDTIPPPPRTRKMRKSA